MLGSSLGYPPNVEPHPSDFTAGLPAEIAFFFIAGAAVVIVALPWAFRAWKDGNSVPILVLLSGLICCLDEAMLDMLGHLHWANDLTFVYANFGVSVPALIPLCYVAFLGLQAYFCYFVMRHGCRQHHLYLLLAMGIITDATMETIGINLGVYGYYGYQPYEFLGFPYWWGFINSASFVTVGFIIWYAAPRLQGIQKLWLLLAAPSGMMCAYFVLGWIHIAAHNSDIGEGWRLAAATLMMVECVLWMKVLGHFVARSEHEPVVNWTLARMFKYHISTASSRQKLMETMIEEGKVNGERARDDEYQGRTVAA